MDVYNSDSDETEEITFHEEINIDTTDKTYDQWLEEKWGEINALEKKFGTLHADGSTDNAETGFIAYDIEKPDAKTVFNELCKSLRNYIENNQKTS